MTPESQGHGVYVALFVCFSFEWEAQLESFLRFSKYSCVTLQYIGELCFDIGLQSLHKQVNSVGDYSRSIVSLWEICQTKHCSQTLEENLEKQRFNQCFIMKSNQILYNTGSSGSNSRYQICGTNNQWFVARRVYLYCPMFLSVNFII